MSRRKNNFTKAMSHLKSNRIDEKINQLEEQPTNNTYGLMTVGDPSHTVQPPDIEVTELDFDKDNDIDDGRNTSGIFNEQGVILTIEPDVGDTSYILGPMSSMYYGWWNGGTSTIGYIRESDRKMVNLGTVPGVFDSWDGTTGFNSYGQLTLEQAQWFKNTPKKNDYRAFYPGPPSNTPDAFGRYLCQITGTPKEFEKTPPPYVTNPTQGPEDPSSQFSGMLNQLMGKLKGAGNSIGNALNNIKDFFGDHITPAAAEYATNIAKSILQNKPITVKQEDVPQGDIDKFLNNLEKGLENYTVHNFTVSQGDPIPYADENIYTDKNGNVQSNIGPNGEKSYYQKDTTGSVGGGTGFLGYGNPLAAAGQAQVQVVYPTDGSEPYLLYTDHAYHNTQSDDPGEVPDPVKAVFSHLVHSVAGHTNYGMDKYVSGLYDVETPNTGNMSGYPPNIRGDVKTEIKIPLSKVPDGIKKKAQFEKQWQDGVKSGKFKAFGQQTNSYKPQGKFLSESKRRILREIKKPYKVPNTPTKFKGIRPKVRVTGKGLMEVPEIPKQFKPEPTIWRKPNYDKNVKASQEKKNEVLEYVGAAADHWEYLTETRRKEKNAKRDAFYSTKKDRDFLYDYWYGGKKHKVTRKEDIDNDCLVYIEDEDGKKFSMLQSKLNEMLEKEQMKDAFDSYIPEEEQGAREKNFDKVTRLKSIVGKIKRGDIGPEYPNEPPPELVNGWHPKLGKKYKHDKLDPQSAEAMPDTGDPEIDANIKKATDAKSKVRKLKTLLGKKA